MEEQRKKQRLLPGRPDSAQHDSPSAPPLGSITGRSSLQVQANRPPITEVSTVWLTWYVVTSAKPLKVSGQTCVPQAASLWHRNRGGSAQDSERRMGSTTASTSGRLPSPAPAESPVRLHAQWQGLTPGAALLLNTL